jgi:hypothetical protein
MNASTFSQCTEKDTSCEKEQSEIREEKKSSVFEAISQKKREEKVRNKQLSMV